MASGKKVYLAGPITGLEYGESVDWRESAKDKLTEGGIRAYSPMRAKDYLDGVGPLESQYFDISVMSSPRGIMTRDRWDATTCDVILVNLLGAKRVSIGTVMEIAWADLSRIPSVVAMEESGNVHEHAMITEAIGFRVPTLDEGINIVKAILLP